MNARAGAPREPRFIGSATRIPVERGEVDDVAEHEIQRRPDARS
jgi:hypothetical protein